MLHYVTLFSYTINLYDFFNNFAYIGEFVVALFFVKPFREIIILPTWLMVSINKKKKNSFLWYWIYFIILCLLFVIIVSITNTLTGNPISQLFLGDTSANFFPNIFIGPITVFLLSILLKSSPLKTVDFAAPIAAVSLVFYKIACFCAGCCYGVEWEYGMWNTKTERMEFPVQLVEIACAVVMLAVLMFLLLNKKMPMKPGLAYPLFMLMYCGSRFISEFWRDDYPDIWGPLKSYHLQCIIGFVEGLIFLFIVLKWGEKITDFFESKNRAFLAKAEAKQQAKKKHIVHKKNRK